ncbi:hypothetical protein [Corynebacterium freiburgense]|uniref:hypothetical protein n=1 Tax=Corynebacterium freiburgense TaxID=556548 RepID=UPI00040FEC05|nr:hypothetical protein [Corynebacterium freiburgense]WJZ03589.1 hypothetical protein CFREI_11655 [Corynebacterium freiburgense]
MRVDILARARKHHIARPNAIIGGWAALAYTGLTNWVSKAPVTLHVTSNYLRTHNPTKPTRRRIRPNTPTWAPDPSYPNMHVAAPEVALIDCLIDLQRNYYTWWTYQVPQQQPWEVRATQLIDALHQHHPLNLPLLHSTARNIFNARKLEKLLNQSHPGSQSPPETALRLIANTIRPNPDIQIPIYEQTPPHRLLTTADAGWEDIKVALFYDGEHHLNRHQRDYDARVQIELREMGWESIRITHGLLRNPNALTKNIQHAIQRATADQFTPITPETALWTPRNTPGR